MRYKVSILFNYGTSNGKNAGWSETWYSEANSPETIVAKSALVSESRAALLPLDTSVIGFRCQQFGKRAFVVNRFFPGGHATQQDIPQMALHAKCYGVGVDNVKFFQLRGIPDSMVTTGTYSPSDAFAAKVQMFAAALTAQQFQFQCQDQAQFVEKIISIDAAGNFEIANNIGFVELGYVNLLRCKNVIGQKVSGVYQIQTKTDNTHGKILGWNKGPVGASGKMRNQAFAYPIVANGTIYPLNVTTRKVGRSFFQYRGRRQKR